MDTVLEEHTDQEFEVELWDIQFLVIDTLSA